MEDGDSGQGSLHSLPNVAGEATLREIQQSRRDIVDRSVEVRQTWFQILILFI